MLKVVFSSTPSTVDWNTRLVTGDAVTEIKRLKADDGGPMDIGGATLAAAAMRAGLIDEYLIVTHPVLVGGGTPFFTTLENWVNLSLVEDPDVSRRRGADQVRNQALTARGGSAGAPGQSTPVRMDLHQVVLRCRYSNSAELRQRLADIATAMALAGIRSIGDGSMTDGQDSDLLAAGVELVDDPIGANP